MKSITTSLLFLFLGLSSIHVKAQELEEFKFHGVDMGIPGLLIQEGFITNLISSSYSFLEQPGRTTLDQ